MLNVQERGAETVQDGAVYEPERVPLVQVRDCEVQVCPYATEEDWYAVTEEPEVMVWLLKVHEAGAEMVQEGAVYEPERVPLVQVRDCEVQVCPYATEEDWYAVTEEPEVMVWLLKVHEMGPETVQALY